jgi:predicted AlkP superfamily pyrophosphatase or phosphodiesterase
MINTDSLSAVRSSRLNEHFVKPLCDTYGFAQIPATIERALTGADGPGLPYSVLGDLPRRYQKVILLFIDGFGWRFLEPRLARDPFLARFAGEGVVSMITTQFPSTTAAHTTTIHTGLPVGQSGVFEWYYYEPRVGQVIAPLLFSYAGDDARDTLCAAGYKPETLFPSATFYQRLAAQGVTSFIFQHRDYTPSSFSDVMFKGARVAGYRTLPEALVNLTKAVARTRGPAYFFLYLDSIDALSHGYGPASRQVEAEIGVVLAALESCLHAGLAGRAHDTLLLVTADHGQVEVSPKTTFYLNRRTPWIKRLLRTDHNGRPLAPAGSARDHFLYVQDHHLEEVQVRLTQELAGHAEVYRTDDLIARGLFGLGAPSAEFLGRVGNLIVLPYRGETVWWFERRRFEQRFWGHHGGLTPEEAQTIFLASAY